MSTRCRIAVHQEDGTFTSIYCHCDGYPDGVGRILAEHYTTEARIRRLIHLGDLSSLGPQLGRKHPWETAWKDHPDWVCAYRRDRGLKDTAALHSATLTDLMEVFRNSDEEYLYVFHGGRWLVFSNKYEASLDRDFVDVASVLSAPTTA